MAGHIKTSKSTTWQTPNHIIDMVKDFYGGEIALDPCASDNPADHFATHNYFLANKDDGLILPWMEDTYCNPPYGKGIDNWVKKANKEKEDCKSDIILLIPASVDTKKYQDTSYGIFHNASAICFIKGRIRFKGAKASAPMPCALIYYNGHEVYQSVKNVVFCDHFSSLGHCVLI
jgi:site-specific DNA-methyltransferase (adenine-specific)